MNKQEFLSEIRSRLAGLSQEDINKSVDYYSEMIDDRMEDGLSEEDAVQELGSAEDIAAAVLMDIPFPKLVRERVNTGRMPGILEIVLIVLGFPIWGSLLVAAVCVIFSLYMVFFGMLIAVYAVGLSLVICAVGGILGMIVMICTGRVPAALFLLGAGLISAGMAVLIIPMLNQIVKAIVSMGKNILVKIKCRIIRKESK